jgi:ATP-dependent RNA helicase RhlE
LIKRDIETQVITGFEPDPSIRAEPIQLGRNTTIGRGNGGGGGRNSSSAPRRNTSGSAPAKTGAKPAGQNRNGNSAPKRAASGNDSRGKSQSYGKR